MRRIGKVAPNEPPYHKGKISSSSSMILFHVRSLICLAGLSVFRSLRGLPDAFLSVGVPRVTDAALILNARP